MRRAAITGWILARLVVAAAYVVSLLLDAQGVFGDSWRVSEGLLTWDGTWYRLIAEDGFANAGEGVRFAPLFAWLGHVVGFLFGGNDSLGLLVVANAAALGAGLALAEYGEVVSPSESKDAARYQARMIGLAVGLSPASFVFVFAYAESLLVVAAAIAALAARRNAWLVAALAGLVAGAARPTGMALSVLMAWLAIAALRSGADLRHRVSIHWSSVAFAVAAPVLGFATHLLAAEWMAGSWRDPITIQSPLRGDFIDPVSRLVRGVQDLAGKDPFGDGLHLPFALFAIVLIWLVWRELGAPEAAYSAAVVLVALSAENWNSLERYTINAFPVLLAMGLWLSKQTRWRYPAIAGSASVMAALTVMSWSGRYVP